MPVTQRGGDLVNPTRGLRSAPSHKMASPATVAGINTNDRLES
jgi:hypothetical protein